MSTTDESVTDESTEIDTADETAEEVEQSEEVAEKPDPDAGAKKALTAERTARKAAEKALNTLKAELANKDKPAEEQAIAERIREATEAVSAKANARLVSAELKAAAAGKVKNPALALKLIDTSGIDVDDEGEVDSDALNQAIADLLEQYPELAPDGSKFGGGADQGAKGKESKPSQLTKQDLESMSAAEINSARREGRLKSLGI